MKQIKISEVTQFNTTHIEAINSLLEQLSSTPTQLTEENLKEIIASVNSHLFLLMCEDNVAGMLTIGSYLSPTGRKHWIEDVVVDSCFRGQSFGRLLIEHAIDYVGKQGKGLLMLTSNPRRVAANELYRTVGFNQKETNVYKIQFP